MPSISINLSKKTLTSLRLLTSVTQSPYWCLHKTVSFQPYIIVLLQYVVLRLCVSFFFFSSLRVHTNAAFHVSVCMNAWMPQPNRSIRFSDNLNVKLHIRVGTKARRRRRRRGIAIRFDSSQIYTLTYACTSHIQTHTDAHRLTSNHSHMIQT